MPMRRPSEGRGPTVAQLLKKFPEVCETGMLITVFVRAPLLVPVFGQMNPVKAYPN